MKQQPLFVILIALASSFLVAYAETDQERLAREMKATRERMQKEQLLYEQNQRAHADRCSKLLRQIAVNCATQNEALAQLRKQSDC